MLLAVVLVASCAVLLVSPDEESDAPSFAGKPALTPSAPPERNSTPSTATTGPTPTPSSQSPRIPTQGQDRERRWRGLYVASAALLFAQVRRAVPEAGEMPSAAKAVATCGEIVRGMPWRTRVRNASQRWGLTGGDVAEQSRKIVAAVTKHVCPDQRGANLVQSASKTAPLPAGNPDPQSPTYYVNCTEVAAAGAAPIYAGDPGCNLDLDRDGDGVACES